MQPARPGAPGGEPPGQLATEFLACVPANHRPSLSLDALGALLDGALRAGAEAYPSLDLPPSGFVRFLAERPDAWAAQPPSRARAADLYLACACALSARGAFEAFRAQLGGDLRAVVRRVVGGDEALCDDVTQAALELLFVDPDGGPGKISLYSGRGELRGWVCIVVAREAVRLARDAGKHAPRGDDALLDVAESGVDPELEPFRRRYREQLRQGFERAMAALSPRERTMLRQHFVDGLTVDALGALYRVHRATAARWVAAAREHLADELSRWLEREAGIGPDDVGSVVRLARSQLDLSLSRLLRDEATSA